MNHNQLFLGVAILSLVILLVNHFISLKIEENFQDSPSTPDANGQCPQKSWWDIQPVRTIISKQSGVHFPVHPLDESLAIKSPILVPINQKGSTKASSCLYVNDDGTYSVSMCDSEIGRHQWMVKVIENQDDFKEVLANKPKQPGDLGDSANRDYSDKEFGFCLVISKHIPYKVLHYENNSLAVRDVGYYTGQQWYISPKKTQAGIAVKPVDHKSLFTPELNLNSKMNLNGGNTYNPVNANANPMLPYLNNGNAVVSDVSESVFGDGVGGSPAGQGGLNFKIVVDSNNELVKEILSGSEEADKKEGFQDGDKKKCKCKGCVPFNLSNYIKNKKIPCYGCNFDQ